MIEHRLTGLCAGIILRRNGRVVSAHLPDQAEPTTSIFKDDERAAAFMWRLADAFYAEAHTAKHTQPAAAAAQSTEAAR